MTARLATTLGGIPLKNPLLPGSGPHTGNCERMLYLAENLGLGGIVTKTIAPEAAQVQRPCIVAGPNAIMNCELWSEYDAARWIDDFLPSYAPCPTPPSSPASATPKTTSFPSCLASTALSTATN